MEREKVVAIKRIMKFFDKKRIYCSVQTAQKELRSREKENLLAYRMPRQYRNFFARYKFSNAPFEPIDVFEKSGSSTALLYLHGGAFSSQPLEFHWDFAKDMYARTGATVYVPLFPLAPKYNYRQTYQALINFYKEICQKHSTIYVMGDSAGATLALGLAHNAREENLPPPAGVVALSPVVDMAFANPEMKKFQRIDPMLCVDGARYMCQKWARGASFQNPYVSPKFIDFRGYPEIYLFYGDKEILCPDLRDFVAIVQQQGGKIFAVEQRNAVHVYPLMPIPRAFDARDMIAKVVTSQALDCKCGLTRLV